MSGLVRYHGWFCSVGFVPLCRVILTTGYKVCQVLSDTRVDFVPLCRMIFTTGYEMCQV